MSITATMNFLFIEEILLDVVDEFIVCNQCDKCLKSFSTLGNLKKHKNTVHDMSFFTGKHFLLPNIDNNNKYLCPNCDKSFKNKQNLKKPQK